MDLVRSPFPQGWSTSGSNEEFWGEGGTYTLIPYDKLPAIEQNRFDGSFGWLPPLANGDLALDFDEARVDQPLQLDSLRAEAKRLGLTIPDSFTKFITTPEIYRRVPTCTACYLDLSERLLEPPVNAPGRFLRFLNDQQTCVLWYLYLRPDGEHAVVAGTPEWPDDAEGETLDDVVTLEDLVFCAPDFEGFVYRFWMENTILYALFEEHPLAREQQVYLDAVQRTRTEGKRM